MNARQLPKAPQPSKGVMAMQTRRPIGPKSIFPPRRDFTSLSLKDLLDAREAYHVYLAQLDNVVATAIGRYCIHQDDWYADNPPDRKRPSNVPRITAARTLANSVIRPWSWPAVLVFVRQWDQRKDLEGNVVPSTLYPQTAGWSRPALLPPLRMKHSRSLWRAHSMQVISWVAATLVYESIKASRRSGPSPVSCEKAAHTMR